MPSFTKFLITLLLVLWVIIYPLIVMVLSGPFLIGAGIVGKVIFYLVAGLAWIIPVLPVIRYSEGKKKGG